MRISRRLSVVLAAAIAVPPAMVGAGTAAAAPQTTTAAAAQQAVAQAQAAVRDATLSARKSRGEARTSRRVGTAAVTPAANPQIAESCGLDATLVLDASGSIKSAGAVETVRNAAQGLAQALKNTNSTLRITQFATFSGQLGARVPVDDTTTGPGGTIAGAIAKYYTPPPPRPAGVDVYERKSGGSYDLNNRALTWTNWQDGFQDVDRTELAIFVTDGDPTAYNVNSTRTNVNESSSGTALDKAITAANGVKGGGTRVLVVGVGNGLTSPNSKERLKKISGPQLATSPDALTGKTINQVDAVAFPEFEALDAFLRSVVTSLCGNSVTVQKLAQSSSGADHLPATGWDVTVKPTINGGYTWVDPSGAPNSAQTRSTAGAQGAAAFKWKPNTPSASASVRISEDVKSGFTANRWACEIKKPDGSTTTPSGNLANGDPGFSIPMSSQDVAACKLYNDFDYQPGITVTKAVADDPVRGNADGWNQTYTFTVRNTGNTPLNSVSLTDPKCGTISGPTGPGADTGILSPGQANEWTYTCAGEIGPVATTTEPLNYTNDVAVSAKDPEGAIVQDQDSVTVAVKTPEINIAKTAKYTDGGAPIADGGTVPAGTRVTYVYTVTNAGNDTLNLVRATAVTDNKCSPVEYKSGDTGNDQKLAQGETWIYECATRLNPPGSVTSVTNVGTVTSTWSNPQHRPQNNGPVTDTASMTINVDRAANLRIIKVTNPGDVNRDFDFTVSGQGVPQSDQAFQLNTSTDPSTPPASRNIALDGPDGGGSQYTITETPESDFAITDLTCDKQPDSTDPESGELKVTILPLQDVTCTYTNERLPSLSITKSAPEGGQKTFDFTASRPAPLPAPDPATFSLANNESQVYGALAPGLITIAETDLPAGWDLDDISCTGADVTERDPDAGTVTLDLAYGDEADCMFTNGELAPAQLTIVKDGTPASWDPQFPFTVSGNGLVDPGQPGTDTFDLGIGESKSYSVRPAKNGTQYSVEEGTLPTPPSGRSGYDNVSLECSVNGGTPDTGTPGAPIDVALSPGDSGVCTFVNQPRPRLTIVKNAVNPADAGDTTSFDFTRTQPEPSVDFSLSNQEEETFVDLAPGEDVTVTEDIPPTDWILTSLTCSGEGADALTINVGERSVSGDLDYGDDVVCTYVNTKEPEKAYLFVLKNTDPVNSPELFDFTAEDGLSFLQTFQLAGGDYQGYEVDPPFGGRDYLVSESAKAGWDLTDIECRNSSAPDTPISGNGRTVTINLLPGQVGVCVFDNQQRASLSVAKVTDVASPQSFDFTAGFTPAGPTPADFSLTGGGTPQVYSNVVAGTQATVTEQVPNTPPDRWDLTGAACSGNETPETFDTDTLTVDLAAGEDVTCTFTNAKVPSATVNIVKAADPADGTSFDFTAVGAEGGVLEPDREFSLAPDGDVAVRTLEVYPTADGEEFTFTERDIPSAWNLDDVRCVDDGTPVGTRTGDSIDVTVNPGDTLTCTFTNRKNATLTVVKEAADDPDQSFDFTWDAANPPDDSFSLKDQESNTVGGLLNGNYTIQEVNLPPDWVLDGPNGAHPTCTGASGTDFSPDNGVVVTLAPGDDAVCTFTNFFEYDPQIELEKTVDRQVVLAGQPVTYTYTVTNTGNVAVTPVGALADVVVDDQCSPVILTNGAAPLTPGESWTFTCTVAAMTPDKATNVATATVKDPTDETKTLTSTDEQTVEVREPSLDLVKTVDQSVVYPGTDVTYTYVATNNGAVAFKGSQNLDEWISDDKCSPVTYVSGDTGDDKIMDVGEQWTYTCSATIDVDTLNTATFTGTPFIPESPESGPEQTGEPLTATDTAEVTVLTKDITITKRATAPGGVEKDGKLLVPVGTRVTYHYDVTTGTATNPMRVLSVSDNKCSPVTYKSGDTNEDGLVDPGETWRYECKQTFTGAVTVTNSVVVTAVEPTLGGLATDTDEATVESFKGSIVLTKAPDKELVPTGTAVTYTFRATNDGTVPLTNIAISDDKCAPLVYRSGDSGNDKVMQPGETWVYTCTATLRVTTTNVANVTGTTPSGAKVGATDSARVQIFNPNRLDAKIKIVKTASKKVVKKGDKVRYTYKVSNPGKVALANVKNNVTDNRCSRVKYVRGDRDRNGLLTSGKEGGGEFAKEVWTFTCITKLRKTTVNTGTAKGRPWINGEIVGKPVRDTDKAKVRVIGTGGGGGNCVPGRGWAIGGQGAQSPALQCRRGRG